MLNSIKRPFVLSIVSFLLFTAVLVFFFQLDLVLSICIAIMLFVHEIGHVVALKILKKKINGLIFVPFLGAVVISGEQIENINEYAFFKYMGPLFGFFSVIFVLIADLLFSEPIFLQIALVGAIMNGVSLIPVDFLDGYGILKGVTKKIKWLGFLMIIFYGWILGEYVFTFFILSLVTLFGEDDATGFKWHEIVSVVLFVIIMATATFFDRPEYLIPNLLYIIITLYIVIIYLRDVLTNKVKYEINIIFNKNKSELQDKFLWVCLWLILEIFFISIIFFIIKI